MSQEGQLLDKKSLRSVLAKMADREGMAEDCVAFTNATGARIEDDLSVRPASQQIPADLTNTLRRGLVERIVDVVALTNILTATNSGQYIDLIHQCIDSGSPRSHIRGSVDPVKEDRLHQEGMRSGSR